MHILPGRPAGKPDQMSPIHAAVPPVREPTVLDQTQNPYVLLPILRPVRVIEERKLLERVRVDERRVAIRAERPSIRVLLVQHVGVAERARACDRGSDRSIVSGIAALCRRASRLYLSTACFCWRCILFTAALNCAGVTFRTMSTVCRGALTQLAAPRAHEAHPDVLPGRTPHETAGRGDARGAREPTQLATTCH